MSDETTEVTETAQDTTPAAETSSPRVFTQEEVDALMGKTRLEERKKYQRKLKESKETKQDMQSDEPQQQSSQQFDAKSEMVRLARVMQRLDKMGLNEMQQDMAMRIYADDSPDDVGDWIQSKIAPLFGNANSQNNQQQPATTEAVQERRPPASDRGAPTSSVPDWERKQNPLEWTKDDIERIYIAKGGEAKGRKFVREQFERFMQGTKVVRHQ